MKKYVVYSCDDFWTEDGVLKIHLPVIRFMTDNYKDAIDYVGKSIYDATICVTLSKQNIEFIYD